MLLDVDQQMAKAADLLDKIPKHIKVFIIPGNHDPRRRALPQPAIPEKHNMHLWNRENFFMLGNPSMLELNGVKILMFHGQSLDDVVGSTPGLSYAQPAKAMRVLLKTRHLSPIYGKRTPIAQNCFVLYCTWIKMIVIILQNDQFWDELDIRISSYSNLYVVAFCSVIEILVRIMHRVIP